MRARFASNPAEQLWLLPRPHKNIDGTNHFETGLINAWFRAWLERIPQIDAGPLDDNGRPVPFDRSAIHPHAFRHTYAQTLADQGVPAPVLRDLMDHRSLSTTLGYYRVQESRKRKAMEVLARHTVDNRGLARPVEGEPSALSHLREHISWVAVPMGKCSEPTNVRAGGQACPIRYQCAGCPHFESDPSYLPELRAYADELRKEREAMLAAGAADWAVDHVSRQLEVIIRPHPRPRGAPRPSSPTTNAPWSRRPPPHCARPASPCRSLSAAGRPAMADNSAALRRPGAKTAGPSASGRPRPSHAMEQEGEPVSFPAVARRAGVSVSLLYADVTLGSRIATARDRQRQAGTDRAWRLPARSLVTEQSLRTELANAKERARRLAEEVGVLRERLSRQLGAAADVARGEALSPLLDELEQRNAELEAENHRQQQRITQLENELRELNENLDAARGMNRELMSELNRRTPALSLRPRPNR